MALLTLWLSATVDTSLSGDLAFYNEGLMRQVAENRGMDMEGYVDGIALMSCGDLGRDVWIQLNDGFIVGPLLVVDCSREQHYQMNIDRGRAADISRELWDDLEFPEDLVPATVWFKEPTGGYYDRVYDCRRPDYGLGSRHCRVR